MEASALEEDAELLRSTGAAALEEDAELLRSTGAAALEEDAGLLRSTGAAGLEQDSRWLRFTAGRLLVPEPSVTLSSVGTANVLDGLLLASSHKINNTLAACRWVWV